MKTSTNSNKNENRFFITKILLPMHRAAFYNSINIIRLAVRKVAFGQKLNSAFVSKANTIMYQNRTVENILIGAIN